MTINLLIEYFGYGILFLIFAIIFFIIINFFSRLVYLNFFDKSYKILKKTLLKPGKIYIPDLYKKSDWFKGYYKEAKLVFKNMCWDPFTYWKSGELRGHYINIDQRGYRQTYVSKNLSKFNDSNEAVRVFCFGGSTMWGWGARDDFTIPSYLSKLSNMKGTARFHFINAAQLGFINMQEVIAFIKLIRSNTPMDMVIFYDGVNDIFAAIQSYLVNAAQNEFIREQEFNQSFYNYLINWFGNEVYINKLLKKFFGGKKESGQVANIDYLSILSKKYVHSYVSNQMIVQQICKKINTVPLFFWQPTIFSKKVLTPMEKDFFTIPSFCSDFYEMTTGLIFSNSNNVAIDLTQSINTDKEIYIDPWHINEYGNEIVAKDMYKYIKQYYYDHN